MKVLLSLLVALPCLKVAQVQAAVACDLERTTPNYLSVPVVGPGISTAAEDAPVGAVLYKGTTGSLNHKGPANRLECKGEPGDPMVDVDLQNDVKVVSTPYGPSVNSGGKDIFPTNVPGIGASFYFQLSFGFTGSPSSWEYPFHTEYHIDGWENIVSLGAVIRVGVELIKTGPIPPGTQQVLGTSLPTFHRVFTTTNPTPQTNIEDIITFTGATTLYTQTCQLANSNIDVYLGKHVINTFDRVGAVSPWQDFDITLKNCPPFYGYGDYNISFGGRLTGSNSANTVALSFKSVNGVIDSNPLIANLDSIADTASGVGIELSRRDVSRSIPLDGSGGFELDNLNSADNATYVIPLKARYVQTESNVTAGVANGAVVFTIVYQ